MKLFGDSLSDAKSMRAVVKTAVDDTGRNLINEKEGQKNEFEKLREWGNQNPQVTLKLKNPARKATTIKELTGEVQLFMPGNDPTATVTVENFQKTGGAPIASPALTAAGINITAYTQEQSDAAKKKQEEERKKAKANVGEALSEAFGSMFSGGGGPNDITVQITDPNQKIVDMEFQDAAGKKIKNNGSSSFGNGDKESKTFMFSSKLPDDARLVIYLATPKTLVSVLFSLKDVYLP